MENKRSYSISSPKKQGSVYVVDISEKQGGVGITRRTTVRYEQVVPFLKAVFGSLPED
jgi:hypothetical protein